MKLETLKAKLITFTELIRIRNALIAFLGVFVGSIVSPYAASNMYIMLAGLSAAAILAGGNAINDYFDVEIDRINKPKRPLPSGRISSSDTLMISLTLFLIGIGISKYINTYCLTIASVNTILLILYAKYSKKALFLSNVCISYLVASIFLYGAAVTLPTQAIDLNKFRLTYILAACAFLMTLSREIIKDIEDVEGDKKQYSSTLPITIGIKNSKRISIALGVLAIVTSILPLTTELQPFNIYTYAPIIALADIIFIISFTQQPAVNQRIMVLGMNLSLLAFLLGKVL